MSFLRLPYQMPVMEIDSIYNTVTLKKHYKQKLTALHYACAIGNKNLVKRLLEYDIEKVTKDTVIINNTSIPKGYSALAIAILFEQDEIINIICKYIELHYHNYERSKLFRKMQYFDESVKENYDGKNQLTIYQYGIIKMVKTPLFYVTQKLFRYCHSANDILLGLKRQNLIMILSYAQYLLLNPNSQFSTELKTALNQNQQLFQSEEFDSMSMLIKVLQFATQDGSDPNIDLRQQQQINDIISKLTVNNPQLAESGITSSQLEQIMQQVNNYEKITQSIKEQQQQTSKKQQFLRRSSVKKPKKHSSSTVNENDIVQNNDKQILDNNNKQSTISNISGILQQASQQNNSSARQDDDEEPQIVFDIGKAPSSLTIKQNKKPINIHDISIQLDDIAKEIELRKNDSSEFKSVKIDQFGLLDDVDDEIISSVKHDKALNGVESVSIEVSNTLGKLKIMKNTKKTRSSTHLHNINFDDDDW